MAGVKFPVLWCPVGNESGWEKSRVLGKARGGIFEKGKDIFPVFVSCEIESGLENSRDLESARPPFFPEPLSRGVRGLESVSIRRERFGPVNYE